MAGSNVVSKWIDSPSAGATPLGRGQVVRQVATEQDEIDRFHNSEHLSPEAMAAALAELRETVESLEGRVAAAEAGSASVVGAAKGLGLSMLNMGDSLSKRIGALEEVAVQAPEPEVAVEAVEEPPALFITPPAAPRKARTLRLSLGLGAVVLAAVIAVVALLPRPAAPPAQLLYSPAAAAPHH